MDDPLGWLRTRMLKAGNPLAASLHYAPAEHQDRILALRAVLAEIAAVPDTVSDTDVGRRKLDWWRQALRERAAHPVIDALVASSAADRLDAEWFDALIGNVQGTLEPPRFERVEEAWQHCLGMGGEAARIEAALVDGRMHAFDDWAALGAYGYLVRLVRDLAIDARANRWLVPLELQADYQVSRRDAAEKTVSRGFHGLARAWLEDGRNRADSALATTPAEGRWQQRHLMIVHAMDRRLARKVARRPGQIVHRRVHSGHAANLWCAWRAARRLRVSRG
ncbi:MAG TPA: squalene/phytoene synthase family protein [Wenzhouxiangella sp.]|nr:squalene/phytoene synthase family protein [Wenzhouxiangella sp.]